MTISDPDPGLEAMTCFVCQLYPPRPTFLADITDEEAALMGAHAAYWAPHLKSGALAFGPVADPRGAWGLALIEAHSLDEVLTIEANDPVILANRGFRFETHAMPSVSLGRGPDRAPHPPSFQQEGAPAQNP